MLDGLNVRGPECVRIEVYGKTLLVYPDRLWSKCVRVGEHLIFTGAGFPKYGHMKLEAVYVKTHVIAYVLTTGPIAAPNIVLHSCHIPACVEPKHLRAGTYSDNNKEAYASARRINPNRLFELDDIAAIHAFTARGMTQQAIADLYAVTQSTISRLLSGARYAACS